MRQLILDLLPDSPPSLDNFVAGGNSETVSALTGWLASEVADPSFCLYGESGCGRSLSPLALQWLQITRAPCFLPIWLENLRRELLRLLTYCTFSSWEAGGVVQITGRMNALTGRMNELTGGEKGQAGTWESLSCKTLLRRQVVTRVWASLLIRAAEGHSPIARGVWGA